MDYLFIKKMNYNQKKVIISIIDYQINYFSYVGLFIREIWIYIAFFVLREPNEIPIIIIVIFNEKTDSTQFFNSSLSHMSYFDLA